MIAEAANYFPDVIIKLEVLRVNRAESFPAMLDRLMTINIYHAIGKFSRRQTDEIFLIFPRKQDLTLHANCLLRRQFA